MHLCALSLVLAFTAAFFSPVSAHAEPAPLVMVTEEWAPFRMNDETAPSGFRGIDVDLTQRLQERLHTPIIIERRPWGRALEMMRSGRADFITGVAYSADRAQYMLYVPTPYTAVQPVFITTKGRGGLIRSYSDLAGKSIAYSLGSDYFEPFNSDKSLHKLGLTNEAQILKVIALGRVDVAIGTEPNLGWDIARGGYGEKVERTAYQPPDRTDLFVAVSRKSPLAGRVDELDAALKGLLDDGTIAAILGKYR